MLRWGLGWVSCLWGALLCLGGVALGGEGAIPPEATDTPAATRDAPSPEGEGDGDALPEKVDRLRGGVVGMGLDQQPEGVWLLPIVNYTSDIGIGYGGLLTYRPRVVQEGRPEQGFRALAIYSTQKNQIYRVGWERLSGASGIHLLVDGFVNRTFYSNYFGSGNGVDPQAPSLDGATQGQQATAAEFYTLFTLTQSEGALLADRALDIREGARVFGVARATYVGVDPFTEARIAEESGVSVPEGFTTLLEEESPNGIAGGPGGQLQLGLMIDSRDRPVSPQKGAFNQISLRGNVYAAPEAGSGPLYGGVNITLQRYLHIWGPWVIASRLVGDFGFGDVPFWDQATFGAASPYPGLGGTLAGRGLVLRHYIGKVKVLWGPELRFSPYTATVRGETLEFSTALFAESGRVWADYEKEGLGAALHTSVGAGLRLIFAQRILIRLDVARALRDEDPTGVYLVFGHPY